MLNENQVGIIVGVSENALFLYWIYASFYSVVNPLNLALGLFILVVMNFYYIEILNKERLISQKSWAEKMFLYLGRAIFAFLVYTIIIGKLCCPLFLLAYLTITMAYIITRRKDLLLP